MNRRCSTVSAVRGHPNPRTGGGALALPGSKISTLMPRRPQPRSFAAPEDLADSDFARDVGSPGVLPFTRDVQPDMYRGRAWTM